MAHAARVAKRHWRTSHHLLVRWEIVSTCQQHAESLAVVLQLDKAPAFPGPTRPWDKGYPHRASGDARPSSAGVPASYYSPTAYIVAVAFALNAAFAVSGPTWLEFCCEERPKLRLPQYPSLCGCGLWLCKGEPDFKHMWRTSCLSISSPRILWRDLLRDSVSYGRFVSVDRTR